MAFVLTKDGYTGWKGATGASVTLHARSSAGGTLLTNAWYNGAKLPITEVTKDKEWTVTFNIVAGGTPIFLIFAGGFADDIDIVEVAADTTEQEIAGATHVLSITLGPLIEGI